MSIEEERSERNKKRVNETSEREKKSIEPLRSSKNEATDFKDNERQSKKKPKDMIVKEAQLCIRHTTDMTFLFKMAIIISIYIYISSDRLYNVTAMEVEIDADEKRKSHLNEIEQNGCDIQ